MKWNDLKVAWRVTARESSYSLIIVFGLAVAMTICILLFGLVRHQYSFDDEVPQAEQIYYVNEFWRSLGDLGKTGGVSLPAMQSVLDAGLPVKATMIRTQGVDIRVGEQLYPVKLGLVRKDFIDIFSVKAVSGDLEGGITRPDSIVLTNKIAKRLFGDLEAVGRTLSIAGKNYTVRAVIPTVPANSSLEYEAVASFDGQFLPEQLRRYLSGGWGTWVGHVYLKTSDASIVPSIAATMDSAFRKSKYYQGLLEFEAKKEGPKGVDFRINQFRQRNLDPNVTDSPLQRPGILLTIASVAVVILLLAMANYLNLATVRVIQRQREIAVRKVLGASAGRLFIQFSVESLLICGLAYMIALVFAWLMLPVFASMLAMEFTRMFDVSAVMVGIVVVFMLALGTAVYPTWLAYQVRPTAVLGGRGNEESYTGARVRRALSVMQFSTAMALTAVGLAYAWQNSFVSQLNPGFDSKNLVVARLPDEASIDAVRAFQQSLLRLEETEALGTSWSPLRDIDGLDAIQRAGQSETATIYRMGVSPDFFRTYGMKAVAGRVFQKQIENEDNQDKIILNQSGAKQAGFSDEQSAIGAYVNVLGKTRQVIGVVSDVRQIDPHKKAQAAMFFIDPRGDWLSIRAKGNQALLLQEVEHAWRQHFPDSLPNVSTIDAQFAKQTSAETSVGKFINLTSLVSIFIAAFGIYALAAYSVQRRTKEIVLRKIHGAGRAAIAQLVGREFLLLVAIAAVIGLPLAYAKIQSYLSEFTDVAPIGMWTLLLALLLGNLVALIATMRHTITAMRILPTQALRN